MSRPERRLNLLTGDWVLVSPQRADDPRLLAALKPLEGSIPVSAMQAANYSVDRDTDKASPAEAARGLSK